MPIEDFQSRYIGSQNSRREREREREKERLGKQRSSACCLYVSPEITSIAHVLVLMYESHGCRAATNFNHSAWFGRYLWCDLS